VRRVALITGATRNVGRAIALRLAAAGHAVVVNGRDADAVAEVVDEITSRGGRANAGVCDVTDPGAVREVVADATRALGPVTILVNSAVQRLEGPLLGTSLDDWRSCLAVTLDGAFTCAQAVLPGMREARFGRIVHLAGAAAQAGAAGRVAVVTAKSGVIGLTKAIAIEFGGDGITANAISPSRLASDRSHLTEAGGSANRDAADAASVPLGRLGTIEEVAATCAFLCSEEAAYINGHVVNVNGGSYV
jgi:NAD(P)-dependent dehydrogenase (short-subunit alcohol dehydrogenase family)